jgi:agmatine deiminase
MRDTGPTFDVNETGNVAGVDWAFNDYGNKDNKPEDGYADSAALATRILERVGSRQFQAPLVLEGGSIHVDGEGTLLTSEQCLLNPNRNPDLSRQQIEAMLCDYTGSKKVIWLGQGLLDDDTDGHVDNLACFVRPGTVMALTCNDPEDDNYSALQDNLARLRQATDARGRPLEIIEVEQPEKRINPVNGLRLAMSYINFYIANGAVVVPGFDQPDRDAAAVRALEQAFPEREVVQVPGQDIIPGGGNVHCITQQQPRGARR